ncbi:MAG: Gfo/Idh/MocA family oxidoreductase [Pirellulales bacterium]|nr:Gfo/Idh/MocA family oxidoreductase [Pirellulales bacterium]
MINVGIIGMGMMGRTHFEAYQLLPNVQVTMICDRNPQRASGNMVGTEGNVLGAGIQRLDMTNITGTTQMADVFNNPELQLIDICTATPTHPELVAAALATGKHVLCEKPLARTAAAARQMVAAAAASPGLFMTAMCLRFWPEWAWLKHAITANRYGRVRSATFRRVTSMPAGWYSKGELSGGALLDLHIHDTDFVYYLFGRPAGVFSRGYSKTSGAVDHLVTQYLYPAGSGPELVVAEGSWSLAPGFGFEMAYTVNCEEATLDYRLGRTPALQVSQNGVLQPIHLPEETGYLCELRYFVDCIHAGERPTVVTLEDPVQCLEILEAEEASVASGQIVSL